MADSFHLAIAWDWGYDREFVAILEHHIHENGLLSYSISHHNTDETLRNMRRGKLRFSALLDRASDTSEDFVPVARSIRRSGGFIINAPESVRHAMDKATMHLEFLTMGITVPFTILISPYNTRRNIELSITDLARLGRPFIIKPANTTGGGTGVILGAETLKDVIESRQHHKSDKYLLQEKIVPETLGLRRAWFRVFWVFGQAIPCWWNDLVHRYDVLTREEIHQHSLRPLLTITRRIHEVCGLDFFSTEIALTPERKFVVVDYVNEICDMRPQSNHINGVPDETVSRISERIARHLRISVQKRGIRRSSRRTSGRFGSLNRS